LILACSPEAGGELAAGGCCRAATADRVAAIRTDQIFPVEINRSTNPMACVPRTTWGKSLKRLNDTAKRMLKQLQKLQS
jgi:hypothetical protein